MGDDAIEAAPLDVRDKGGDLQAVAHEVVEEPLEVVDEQLLVGEEALGGEVVLLAEPGHGGVEVPGVGGEVAQGAVEVAHAQVDGGGVDGVDGGAQRPEVLTDVPEQGALQGARVFGGPEDRQDGVVSGVPGGGELPQLAPAVEVLEAGDTARVLRPGDRPPVAELFQVLREAGGVVPGGGELPGDLLGAHLHLVALLGRHEDPEHGGVQRRRGFHGGPQHLELLALVDVERLRVERSPRLLVHGRHHTEGVRHFRGPRSGPPGLRAPRAPGPQGSGPPGLRAPGRLARPPCRPARRQGA